MTGAESVFGVQRFWQVREVGPLLLGNSLQEPVYQIYEARGDRTVEVLRLRLLGIQPWHNMTPSDSLGNGHQLAPPARTKRGRDSAGLALKLFASDWQDLLQKFLAATKQRHRESHLLGRKQRPDVPQRLLGLAYGLPEIRDSLFRVGNRLF